MYDPFTHQPQIMNWVVVSNIFYFHPYLGKIPILTFIFFKGVGEKPPSSEAIAAVSTSQVFFEKL